MMKAAIYYGKNDIRVEEKSIPVVGPKDVLVRNLRGGICGTDINIVKVGAGNMGISLGSEFGHEMVGDVVEIGSEVSSQIEIGMRVGINPITAKKVGRRKSLECSGFSQYVLVEEAELNHNLYVIDKSVPVEVASLIEPMSVGRHGAFSANPQPEDRIVVMGGGPIGLLAAASLIAEGMKNVCVVDIDEWRLSKAAGLGALTVNTAETTLEEGLAEHFGTVNVYGIEVPDVDVFIDAAGAPVLFENIMKIVKPKARISIIAVYKTEVPISLQQVMSKEVQVKGSSGYTHEDFSKVVEHLTSFKSELSTLITQVYKLDDVQEAFNKAIDAKGTVKVVVDLT
ncbi:2-desacetyl-2-hydroxyethyl bacteriochlorophyllide A dehydrogenase [Paenibacillus algorifonticola]|uniref:2-desacetyl-2-hydroxyethyl bacteriochlorophyllide A dehydrogenase n=1 Tax=Paenibacillus algorifonticola TaxID=684063 RepID=A0A1I1YYY5_9BACL|nr:zinc-binding dehydrogenase [Paenibacillus algorifonticola]SFE23383.1 2-desacetyl-2-hydroxyethyl bacteriochlorophyllide A dehydrogenase [Paenibacillus algorifonticola]